MKSIKDPAETRKIEGYKKLELNIAELLIKYDNSLKELSYCQCGSNSECYESMKENIKIIFGSGIEIERIEQIIKIAIEKRTPDVFAAELSRIEFENQQKFQKLIEENKFKEIEILRGDKCETASVNSKEINPEEEDETREPRPDEPEEYWKFAKCYDCKFYNRKINACLFHDAYVPEYDNCSHFEVLKENNSEKYEVIIAEKIIKDSQILLYYALNKRHEKYYKQLADNIIMFQETLDNFIKRLKEEVK